MKSRPLFWTALFLIMGITLGYFININIYILIVLLVFFITCGTFCWLKNYEKYSRVVIVITVILTGLFLVEFEEAKYNSKWSIADWNGNGEKVVLGEVVLDLAALEGNKIYLKPLYVNGHRVKYGLIQLDQRYIKEDLVNGDIVRVYLVLQTPYRQTNPGSFSQYKYLFKKGVFSKGYVTGPVSKTYFKKHPVKKIIISLKRQLIKNIDSNLISPYNEVIKALTLGEKSNLPREWDRWFSQAGANHLLAISGLHVGFIVIMLLTIVKIFKLPTGWQNFFITLFLVIYIIMTGFRSSVFRAGILSLVFLWAPYFNREADFFNTLGLAAILNLVINPLSLFMVGFQLTYLVLIFIILWSGILKKYLGNIVAVSGAALLGSSPIISYYFNIITPIGILTNIWAIPLAGLVVSMSMIGLILGLVHPVFSLVIFRLFVYYLLRLLGTGMKFMALLPFDIEVPQPPLFILLAIYSVLIYLPFLLKTRYIPYNIKRQKMKLKWAGVLVTCLIVMMVLMGIFPSQLEIIFFDVGQGDAIIINLPDGHHIMVDGGGWLTKSSTRADKVLLPYLRDRGIKKIDIVFITHFDADHALGVLTILKNREVGLLCIPEVDKNSTLCQKILAVAFKKDIPVHIVKKGDYFKSGSVFLKIFNSGTKGSLYSRNDNSIVLKLSYGKFDLLLTGDAGKKVEYNLMRSGQLLKSEVLKLAHHGSEDSSSSLFLKKVLPEDVIISVGPNKYGHPSPSVLNRVQNIRARVWRTDKQGAIVINTNGREYEIKSFLQQN
ncbi:DNA internalization-related competence protein ComEC/Rec2 [Halothermothrix orenii]|uniref:DNA internalization-related competence protein ComEC/Rec2 n=1 Tax=Halothermothrix orenii (strain H 168 / OCM 544 / DSM 9562) TaxID=373903 RepID=B8CXM3_HALOH|nr:DNA internalization-related competence protein ComEC/Rec2 [Halothermothrix orenii]ACL70042.1 DNA internalization-related competence protein ComEC/Rec2 [Halothermothrix orenii H 168]